MSFPGGVPPGPTPDGGFVGSVIGLLGLDLVVLYHSTLCRRAETLEVSRRRDRRPAPPAQSGTRQDGRIRTIPTRSSLALST